MYWHENAGFRLAFWRRGELVTGRLRAVTALGRQARHAEKRQLLDSEVTDNPSFYPCNIRVATDGAR